MPTAGPALQPVARFTVAGEPVAKQRARVSSKTHRGYTPAKTMAAENRVAWEFRKAVMGQRWQPLPVVPFGVAATFYCAKNPARDVDNLLKLVLDALNKIAWADDKQVLWISAQVARHPGVEPHSDIAVFRLPEPETP